MNALVDVKDVKGENEFIKLMNTHKNRQKKASEEINHEKVIKNFILQMNEDNLLEDLKLDREKER